MPTLPQIGSADAPASVGRLLDRSAAAGDGKLLAFLRFVVHVSPSMLRLAVPTGVCDGQLHLPAQ